MGKVFSPVTLSNFSWGVPGILRPDETISKAKLSHHMKETHCGHLYSQPYPCRFYPDIMTKGKELNMDLKNLHLWSQLSRHHNNIALFFLVENHGRRLWGADSHHSYFTHSCESSQCMLKVTPGWNQIFSFFLIHDQMFIKCVMCNYLFTHQLVVAFQVCMLPAGKLQG